MKVMIRAVLLILVAGSVSAASAQTPSIPQRLSIEDAVRLALERNPQSAVARAIVQIAEAGGIDARLRPNPAASIESESYPLFDSPRPSFLKGQELTIRVDQEIETAGRRRHRIDVADAGLAAARLESRDRLRRLELVVRRAYLHLVLAQADHTVARTALEEMDRVLNVSRERVRIGEAARSEVSRLEVERLRFAEDVFAAELALRNARAALLTLFGSADLTQSIEAEDVLGEIPASGPPRGLALIPLPAAPAPGVERPDLLSARESLRRTESETRLQRALRTPNITLGGGYKRDFGSNAIVFGVTVPLTLWNKNQGGIARAAAERQMAQSNLISIDLEVKLEVQLAQNAVETNRMRATFIEENVLASARAARDTIAESYRLGAADLIDFLDAQRAYRETLRAYNRALFEYRVSLAELSAARGGSSLQ